MRSPTPVWRGESALKIQSARGLPKPSGPRSTGGVMRFLSRWPLIFALGIATVLLSWWGYYGPGGENPHLHPIDWVASTVGLFKITFKLPTEPWALNVARYTGAIFTLSALAKVWTRLCREQVRRFRLRRWRRHVVVCGMGRKGLRLAQAFRQLGHRVAVMETAPKDDDLRGCQRAGILVEPGDATKDDTLATARVEHARFVFAVCRDDATNLDIAMETLARFRKSKAAGPLDCYVHLFNLPLRVLLQRHEVLRKRPAGFEIRLFNIFENTARALFAQHPLEREPVSARKRVHLVVIGLTRLGEAVITQAARVAHYPDLRPAQVTVVDEKAEARGEDFLARQPGIAESCELRLCNLRLTESRFSRLEFLGEEAADEERTIVLCLDQDDENVSLALRLAERVKDGRVPILARVGERRGLGRLLAAADEELAGKGIRTFGTIEEVCGWEALRDEYLDHLAKGLHAQYQANHGGPGWVDLTEDIRHSNRAAADHIDIKLNAIGCERVAGKDLPGDAPAFKFTHEEIELLSRMEHLRWCADRWLSGWTLGKVKDHQRKNHPNLVSWEELLEADREKDREQVRLIPEVLDTSGFAIRRKEPAMLARSAGVPA